MHINASVIAHMLFSSNNCRKLIDVMREGSSSKAGPQQGASTDSGQAFEAAYLGLLRSGELARRVETAQRHLEDWDLCARYCHVNRLETVKGAVCRTGERAVVYSLGPHHGEEDCLRGRRGSGTVFFSWCNLRCIFCQNWEISWKGQGKEMTAEELAGAMLELQEVGCHNINFVSPSHVVAQILEAVLLAAEKGLRLPLVYNTGGYDSPEALALLDGVIDIYMPDMKYGASHLARRYSHIRDYVAHNRTAVREMHRQVGDLVLDAEGLARRGLLVRHLILPSGIAGTERVIKFLAEEISCNTYINLMDQYRPCYRAGNYPELDRPITSAEYKKALEIARRYGLMRLDQRQIAQGFGWD
jgi:putative pyruvate formate lyase activating enzyme